MLNSLVFDEARYQRLLEGAATLVGDGEWPDAEEVRSLISCIDNTTLNGNYTEASVSAFVRTRWSCSRAPCRRWLRR